MQAISEGNRLCCGAALSGMERRFLAQVLSTAAKNNCLPVGELQRHRRLRTHIGMVEAKPVTNDHPQKLEHARVCHLLDEHRRTRDFC